MLDCAALETFPNASHFTMIDVLLPAGGRIKDAFAQEAGVQIKALLAVDGQTLLERVVSAARGMENVGRVVIVGPPELQSHLGAREADIVLPEVDDQPASGPANIFKGLQWLKEQQNPGEERRVLVVTTDLPFVSAPVLNDFIQKCPAHAGVCLPAISKAQFEARFPDSGGEYVRLRDGEWTLGCAFLLDPEPLFQARQHIEQVFQARKNQWQMARLLGPMLIARFATKRLTLNHIQARCEQILGCSGAVVLGSAPELAFDIDNPQEWHAARQQLESSR